jgi:lipopolysaccharide transport system permease protein
MTLANSRPTQPKIISAQRDSARQYASPIRMIRNLWAHRELIIQFTRREVLQRYQGSYLGLLWTFVMPLSILLVYTFVFSVIFESSWTEAPTNSQVGFALILFAGLIVFNVFSETIVAAPGLVISHTNYVKKVVFPLEVLSVSNLGSALVNSVFSIIILLIGTLFAQGYIPWTIIFLPLMYLPLIFFCLGLSWFLASLGVFIRDIGPLLEAVMRILFFLCPIIYPISRVPEYLRPILYLNPLTFIINHFRRILLFGQSPDWLEFGILTFCTFMICMLGYIWFMKSKKTFADII